MNTTTPTIEEAVARMKREIILDVTAGKVAPDCRSFAELHNHVDANCYGGFCDDKTASELIAHFGGRNAEDEMPEAFVNFTNAAQNAIDTWIKDGGIRRSIVAQRQVHRPS